VTKDLNIHGFHTHPERFGELSAYGSDAPEVRDLIRSEPRFGDRLHPRLRPFLGEVVWAVREEMARTVDDVLSRRTRSLILDARAAVEAAPKVAALMAEELGQSRDWVDSEVETFSSLAEGYLLP
jgi:glycerol-3-phosphate dehydrogenase